MTLLLCPAWDTVEGTGQKKAGSLPHSSKVNGFAQVKNDTSPMWTLPEGIVLRQ